MSYLVDTSVWSLALRRDVPDTTREVAELKRALEAGDEILVTGLVLQELLPAFETVGLGGSVTVGEKRRDSEQYDQAEEYEVRPFHRVSSFSIHAP